MKKLIIYYNYGEGIGDTLISIYDILSLNNFIREEHPNITTELHINYVRPGDNLPYMLNIPFLRSCFKNVTFNRGLLINNGSLKIGDLEYIRLFSCNNPNVNNSIPGCFDVFCSKQDKLFLSNLSINYSDFVYSLSSSNVIDFPILNNQVFKDANKFVSAEFTEDFEAIFYREFKTVNRPSIDKFIELLIPKLDKSKKYFFCSNSLEIKSIFDDLDFNFTYFRPIDKHPSDRVPDGFSPFKEDMYYALGDMIVMSKASKIYSGISRMHQSLFTFYCSSVKNVPVEFIPAFELTRI